MQRKVAAGSEQLASNIRFGEETPQHNEEIPKIKKDFLKKKRYKCLTYAIVEPFL